MAWSRGSPDYNSIEYYILYARHLIIRTMRVHPRKLFLALVGTICLIWFVRYLRFRNLDWEFLDDEDQLGHVRNPGMKHDKWIVVTSIRHPTEAVKALNYLNGWKLIVVGDRKTPRNWSLDGVLYLSPAAQKKLAYKVYPLMPYDSYTRKMIGYLYAIEHGAEYIYETDDDNFPAVGPETFQLSMGHTEALVVNTKNLTHNHHRHFGQTTTWPRGYPLEYVGLTDSRDYTLCSIHVPSIQQGLVSGDPDVDAMFRLTRAHGKAKLDLRFDNGAPPIVPPKGTFVPLNSQNTLFTAKAFWAMLLPTTVSDRATDIYRAYWAQRLLWLLGDNVGVFPPNSHQKRNPHSSLNDATEEAELYQNVGHLVRFLHGWACKAVFFFDCASQLAHDMVTQGFWMRRDAELVDTWITDLSTIGYAPPAMKIRDVCVDDKQRHVVFYPDEQNTTMPHSPHPVLISDLTNHADIKETLSTTCSSQHEVHYGQIINTVTRYENIVLVVGITDTDVVPLIEAAHRPSFPHIIFCSAKNLNPKFFHSWRLSFMRTAHDETTGPSCIKLAMAMHHNVDGYMYISDHSWMARGGGDLPLKHPNLMWNTGEVDVYKPDMEALCEQRALECTPISKDLIEQFITQVPSLPGETKVKSEFRQCLVKIASDPQFITKAKLLWLTDYSFYLPSRLKEMLGFVDKLFYGSKSKRKYDFLVPQLIECLELTVEYLQYIQLSDLDQSSNVQYMLPFSFKQLLHGKDSLFKTHFCQYFQDLNH